MQLVLTVPEGQQQQQASRPTTASIKTNNCYELKKKHQQLLRIKEKN